MRKWFAYIFSGILILIISTKYFYPQIYTEYGLVIAIVVLLGVITISSFLVNDLKYLEKVRKEIVEKGKKIPVNFDNCKIRTPKTNDTEVNFVFIELIINGNKQVFESDEIFCNRIDLLKQLKKHRTTNVYYSKELGNYIDLKEVLNACNHSNQSFYLKTFHRFMDKNVYKKY